METQMLAERLEGERFKWIKWNLLGFALWDGNRIIQNHLFPGQFEAFLTPFILIGAVIWLITLFRITRLSRLLKRDKRLNTILNDELIVSHRLKAFSLGFAILLATQVLIQVVSLFHPFSSLLGAEVSIFVGVVASAVAFLAYHR